MNSLMGDEDSPMPEVKSEVSKLQEKILKCCVGDKAILAQDTDSNIIILGDFSSLKSMCESVKISIGQSSTRCTEHQSRPILKICNLKNNRHLPLLSCLLPRKDEKIYKQLFELLTDVCGKRGLTFLPGEIVVDFENFEQAIHTAIQEFWTVGNVSCPPELRLKKNLTDGKIENSGKIDNFNLSRIF